MILPLIVLKTVAIILIFFERKLSCASLHSKRPWWQGAFAHLVGFESTAKRPTVTDSQHAGNLATYVARVQEDVEKGTTCEVAVLETDRSPLKDFGAPRWQLWQLGCEYDG